MPSKIEKLSDLTKWFNGTDLIELGYKRDDYKLSLIKEGESIENTYITSNLTGIFSPSIGYFSFTKKGKSQGDIKKGMKVKKGDILGYVKEGNSIIEVAAVVDGTIKVISVKEGDVVEYGQLLFILE